MKHFIRFSPRFSDLDAMGHINNSVYLTYLEDGRIAYFQDVLQMPKNSLAFNAIVAKIEIEYLRPVSFGDNLKVYTRFSRLGGKSYDIESLIVLEGSEGEIPVARGLTKMVCFNYEAKKSVEIPAAMRGKIAAFES